LTYSSTFRSGARRKLRPQPGFAGGMLKGSSRRRGHGGSERVSRTGVLRKEAVHRLKECCRLVARKLEHYLHRARVDEHVERRDRRRREKTELEVILVDREGKR